MNREKNHPEKLRLCLFVLGLSLFAFGLLDAQTTNDSASYLPTDSVASATVTNVDVDDVYTHADAGELGADAAFGDEPGVPENLPGVLEFFQSGKYLVYLILAGAGLILLFIRRINLWVRIGFMLAAFIIFGLESFSISGTFLGELLAALGTFLLVAFGKRHRLTGIVFIAFGAIVAIADLVSGFSISAYPMHPSPMCASTKLFMFGMVRGVIFPGLLAGFLGIIIPSLIGRKLFCGWVCPLGALQDLTNKIPFRWRYKNFSFLLFNSVRMTLLAFFFLTFFAVRNHILWLSEKVEADATSDIWIGFSSFNIYESVNFFELFHQMSYIYDRTIELITGMISFEIWYDMISVDVEIMFFVMIGILLIASLFLYRPFCYSICPIGAVTWLLEKIAPFRVRVDLNKCTSCGVCEKVSPCPTIKPLYQGASEMTLPDCTSCGECLNSCPVDAISFGIPHFKK